ncbi:MAG: class I SAM-dependent methyltransferase [Actinomycetota bacterium]|nr:class I SAM-dependent methyltransferase [Actinomycetota bacterium]
MSLETNAAAVGGPRVRSGGPVDAMRRELMAESYKVDQRRQWDGAAQELRAWWPVFEGFMAPVTEAMLDHADLQRGAQVVDVASGFGEPALTVASRLGPEGRVIATDLSPAMLTVAAERARSLRLANVDFVEMDAEEPTLPQGRFDSVVCRLGLMFLPHLDLALERLTGLLVPGGRMVAAVWGPSQANPWLDLALRTLVEYLELPPPPPEAPWLFGLGGGGVLEGAIAGAGLEDIRCTRVTLRCAWPSAAAYTAFHQTSPMRRLVADEEPTRRAQAWQEVTAAALRRWGHGPLRLRGEIVVVSGQVRQWDPRVQASRETSPIRVTPVAVGSCCCP